MAEGQTLADPAGSRDASRGEWIAIDAAFSRSRSGIGTYSARLIRELRAGPLGDRVLALAPEPGASRTLWMVGQVEAELRRRRAMLFHGLANFDLPLTKPMGTRYVLTLHDLIPLEWPESVSRSYRLQFRAWLARCLRLADAIICPTLAVAEAVRVAFPSAPPTRVVPMGVARVRRGAREPATARYFFVLGSVEVRKNLSMLLEAFMSNQERWRRERVELWVAGQIGFGGSSVVAELHRGHGAGVRYLGPQEPRAVATFMRGALALCAPSLAEGFGLPPLEAMALGIPVLASDIPAHREVLGDAAVLLPPNDPDAWSSSMLRIFEDPDSGALLRRLGATRAAEFTWARTARQTEAVYAEVLGADRLSGH